MAKCKRCFGCLRWRSEIIPVRLFPSIFTENTKYDLDTRFLFTFNSALLTLISYRGLPSDAASGKWILSFPFIIPLRLTFRSLSSHPEALSRQPSKKIGPLDLPLVLHLRPLNNQTGKQFLNPSFPPSQDVQDDADGGTEMGSVVGSEEWIGEDDRASDSIAPSVMSEPEYQRHRLLMQHPPRSFPSSLVI